MKPQKILLPIDLANCPIGIFEMINRFGLGSPIEVILLHIVTLNVRAAENRVYGELGRAAHAHLQQLASKYLRPSISTIPRVRLGKPAEGILAQARIDCPDLVLLPVHRSSSGKNPAVPRRPRAMGSLSGLVRRVMRNAPCDVLVIPMDTYFNCEKEWGRLAGQPSTAPG